MEAAPAVRTAHHRERFHQRGVLDVDDRVGSNEILKVEVHDGAIRGGAEQAPTVKVAWASSTSFWSYKSTHQHPNAWFVMTEMARGG